MRILKRLAFLFLAAPLPAKVYYVNQGVYYHVGDSRYARSEDAAMVGAYPVIGRQWLQAFRVSQDDEVKVRIRSIQGVDDCPYCKIIVAIDEHDMGRLTAENNHSPFETLEPLAYHAAAQETHLLKITSYGDQRVDDFLIEGISVETQKADLLFLKPGPLMREPEDPLPVFQVPLEAPSCEGSPRPWLSSPFVLDGMKAPAESGELDQLKAGEAIEFSVSAEQADASADFVKRNVELRLGGSPAWGWVLSFDQRGSSILRGNQIVAGEYRAASFQVSGQGGKLRISRCPDGTALLSMNGKELSRLPMGPAPAALRIRVSSLKARFQP
jgi:hypothetical protein